MRRTSDSRRDTTDLILVAGADPTYWPIVRGALKGDCASAFAVDLHGTLDVLARDRPSLLLLCSDLLDATARDCLERVRARYRHLPTIVVAGDGRATPSSEGVDRNVVWLPELCGAEQIAAAVDKLLAVPRRRRAETAPLRSAVRRPMVMGTSPAFRRIVDTIRRVAVADVAVLLIGETGCGKEVLARRLHCASDRANAPFRAVSVPAVPRELFESVLFGHHRGAFTGAVADSDGAFGQAHGGTLFLDEISSLAMECQVKLLRAIQEGEIEPVGGAAPKPCDVRIVAASNIDLRDAVAAHEFREDLYHRLSVVTIEIPPLRERPEDIPPLVEHFVRKYASKFRREPPELNADVMRALQRHEWTGNVRELENCVQKALLLSPEPTLRAEDLLGEVRARPADSDIEFASCRHSLAEVEQAYVRRVVAHTGGNQSRAAEILGISRKTLRAKLRKSAEHVGYLRAPARRASGQAE